MNLPPITSLSIYVPYQISHSHIVLSIHSHDNPPTMFGISYCYSHNYSVIVLEIISVSTHMQNLMVGVVVDLMMQHNYQMDFVV
jgi:hypothetical protein